MESFQRGIVRIPPFQMKIGPGLPGREPDLLLVAREHLHSLKKTHLAGPADLAVEVIGPDSRARDRVEKFYEYERGGVLEYWIIDPEEKRAEFYQLGEDGKYRRAPVGPDGIYRSAILVGLWIRVDWFWQEPLPPVMGILKEWGLV